MSNLAKSKLTSKYQATIPEEVRTALKLSKGDTVFFEIKDGNTVILRKASKADLEWYESLSSTLSEWNSENDDKAYESL